MCEIDLLPGFGERLKEAIQRKGYTQKELSEILGVNQDTITNYVQERSFPKADMLLNICQLLDVSADWLLKGRTEYLDMTGLSEEESKLIRIFRMLDLRDKEEIMLMLKLKYDLTLRRKENSNPRNNGNK
ncbi:helix-turn-helix transcriptional regulator [Tepidanaerobacter syntrophicus]|uniref:helix-turn-helix domain-containing protein n=1 Tax=Tepidanaerobacter syntrophicus TaxID=224999 RepID=UPI000B091EAA